MATSGQLSSSIVREWEQDAVAFRRAGPEDVPAIVALVESAYRGASSRKGWTTEADLLDGQRTDVAAVRAEIDRGEGVLLLATSGGTAVGCCQLLPRGAGGAYFGMLAVDPGLQGKAIGGAVLAEAERIARTEWGARTMRMKVIGQREDLIAWYRRRGYEQTGETEPFPYGDSRFGIPLRDDLEFVVLEKSIA